MSNQPTSQQPNENRAQYVERRLAELGWQRIRTDSDYFVGTTGFYARLMIDVIYDEASFHMAVVTRTDAAHVGQKVGGVLKGAEVVTALLDDTLAAPTQNIDLSS